VAKVRKGKQVQPLTVIKFRNKYLFVKDSRLTFEDGNPESDAKRISHINCSSGFYVINPKNGRIVNKDLLLQPARMTYHDCLPAVVSQLQAFVVRNQAADRRFPAIHKK
jgi:hypothetical protein